MVSHLRAFGFVLQLNATSLVFARFLNMFYYIFFASWRRFHGTGSWHTHRERHTHSYGVCGKMSNEQMRKML